MPEQVRLLSDPALRKLCSPVNPLDMVFVQGLLDMMSETMVAEQGIGLAANQIGHSVRIFILKEGDSYKEFINPVILQADDLVAFEGEACLSIPGTSGTTKRYKYIKLFWLDKSGTPQEGEFRDMMAFAVQHEVDHLDGKLYVDQFGPLKRDLTLSKHKKYLKEIRRR